MHMAIRLLYLFYGKGIYCNDHIYREGGQTTLLADAYGKIILPNRDTLQNVIRLYTLRSYFICMDIDSIALDTARLHQVIEEHYEWYARGIDILSLKLLRVPLMLV